MFESISKRQSIRNYKMEKSQEMKEEILNAMKNLIPFNKTSTVSLKLIEHDQTDKRVRAPYYIAVRTNDNDIDRDSIGFVGEQLVLKLTGMGYGTCWLGGTGPKMPKVEGKKNIICISVGRADKELYRKDISQFKRKPLNGICSGNCNKDIAEAIRLAPSAINLQPWYIYSDGNLIHMYRRKCVGPFYLEKITSIDIGIALCHLDVAAKHLGQNPTYQEQEHPELKGKKYVITAILGE